MIREYRMKHFKSTKNPVTWQTSADQRRLIGHMVLHKTENSISGGPGLKVAGGRRSDNGRLGAFITCVKPGSVADTIGRLKAGDEVLEWNGQVLQNATFEQVYEIISASKHESQVEIIVSRPSKLVVQ
ncbi:PDZ/DHR/GLGF domain protein [Dictyocaulus viviparus]|uniref:PDZ/DHR/GLGF domain protein n=1 Tax=Dictyocaulus viviparus TaxID=29172 RepID=A0A0D8XBI6_DICVI|nr:PDZ/DHR/GLGF domain protein [Dictyocaulus viviparus]